MRVISLIILIIISSSIILAKEHDHPQGQVYEESDDEIIRGDKDGVYLTNKAYEKLIRMAAVGVPFKECKIVPTFDGYELDEKYGVLYAKFGYKNDCNMDIMIPKSLNNLFDPSPNDRGQIETFEIGKKSNVFKIPMEPGVTISWYLRGPDQRMRHVCVGGKFFTE